MTELGMTELGMTELGMTELGMVSPALSLSTAAVTPLLGYSKHSHPCSTNTPKARPLKLSSRCAQSGLALIRSSERLFVVLSDTSLAISSSPNHSHTTIRLYDDADGCNRYPIRRGSG